MGGLQPSDGAGAIVEHQAPVPVCYQHAALPPALSPHTLALTPIYHPHPALPWVTPAGHCLASAGDSGELLIWRPLPGSSTLPPAPSAHLTTPGPQKDSTPAGSSSPSPYGSPAPTAATATAPTAPTAAAAGAEEAGGWAQAGAWKLSATLRGHHDDVTDVAWAHDDAVVMSGSVENEVMMFDVESRRSLVSDAAAAAAVVGGVLGGVCCEGSWAVSL